jgi:hypothetical protein
MIGWVGHLLAYFGLEDKAAGRLEKMRRVSLPPGRRGWIVVSQDLQRLQGRYGVSIVSEVPAGEEAPEGVEERLGAGKDAEAEVLLASAVIIGKRKGQSDPRPADVFRGFACGDLEDANARHARLYGGMTIVPH